MIYDAHLTYGSHSLGIKKPRLNFTKKKWRDYVLTHLRHIERSSQIAHMIVRVTTINVHYTYPCKLKGPEKALRKYILHI